MGLGLGVQCLGFWFAFAGFQGYEALGFSVLRFEGVSLEWW